MMKCQSIGEGAEGITKSLSMLDIVLVWPIWVNVSKMIHKILYFPMIISLTGRPLQHYLWLSNKECDKGSLFFFNVRDVIYCNNTWLVVAHCACILKFKSFFWRSSSDSFNYPNFFRTHLARQAGVPNNLSTFTAQQLMVEDELQFWTWKAINYVMILWNSTLTQRGGVKQKQKSREKQSTLLSNKICWGNSEI